MPSVFRYKLSSEVIVGDDNALMTLTKRLNIFQRAWYFKKEEVNVRIQNIGLTYNPRTGTLGSGKIIARIVDNRIDPDQGDRTINEMEFDASEKMTASWSSCIWLPKEEFINPIDPPVILEMSLIECNMTAGHSVGRMVIRVEVVASESMDKFIFKAPTARITKDPYSIAASSSQRFAIKECSSNRDRVELKRSASTSKVVARHSALGDRVLSRGRLG
ncbi:TPA_asm: P3 [Utricularia alphacytorhabdovirus 1]|nr:TPA_asm: P3 [Utricularia alphacytorhabdovirus 1]